MGVACNGSKFRYFDVGIANDGNGWYPSVYGKNVYLQNTGGGYTLDPSIQYYHTGNIVVKTQNGETGTQLPGNGIVTLKLEAGVYTNRDYVRFTYTCGGMTGTIAFNAAKGTMHIRSNNKPYVRGILLDGGGSTQLVGNSITVSSNRPISQTVALVKKNNSCKRDCCGSPLCTLPIKSPC